MNTDEKKKYLKWYRIAQEFINDKALIPDLTDEKILKMVSGNDWLSLVSTGTDLESTRNSKNPNIFISIRNEKMDIGLVFNTASSIDKINNILLHHSEEQREKIMYLLRRLDDNYYTTIGKITKKKYWCETPTYSEYILNEKSNKIDDKFIEQMFKESQRIREEGKIKKEKHQVSFEGPHIGLVRIEIDLDEEDFKRRIKELIEIWKICVMIESNSQIESKFKKKEKELDELKKQKEFIDRENDEEKQKSLMEHYKRIGRMDIFEKLTQNRDYVNKRISELEKEIDEMKKK